MTLLHHDLTGPEDGPPLVLAGSLGTSLEMWEFQWPLSVRHRLVALDVRGHGRSPVPPGPYTIAELGGDVLETMDSLGLARASFCGVSIGGMIGMWLGAHAPERIERLVLVCTSARLGPPEAWRERIDTVRGAGSVDPLADAVVARWLTPPFAAAHPELRDRLRAMLAGCDPEGYAGCCAAIETMDLRDELPAISAPTLVISGSEDQATPPEHQELIAARVPGARHEVVSPAAHIAVVERPEHVNRLIEEHLR